MPTQEEEISREKLEVLCKTYDKDSYVYRFLGVTKHNFVTLCKKYGISRPSDRRKKKRASQRASRKAADVPAEERKRNQLAFLNSIDKDFD